MIRRRARWRDALPVLALALVAGACGQGAGADPEDAATTEQPATTAAPTTTVTAPTMTASTVPTTTTAPAPTTEAPTTTAPHPARIVRPQAFVPYATAGDVTLHHPSDRVEAIGFHQSGHDGAQHQTAVATAVRWFTMDDRDRDTDRQGAADIVVEPNRALRVPVTGTVIRGGTYTLYCDYTDQYVVIEPDAHPGWEVKVFHFEGLALSKGQHVEAGVTPLGSRARVLPFSSQVEEDTGVPPWPHVHVEVVDPSVPDRPTGGGCS